MRKHRIRGGDGYVNFDDETLNASKRVFELNGAALGNIPGAFMIRLTLRNHVLNGLIGRYEPMLKGTNPTNHNVGRVSMCSNLEIICKCENNGDLNIKNWVLTVTKKSDEQNATPTHKSGGGYDSLADCILENEHNNLPSTVIDITSYQGKKLFADIVNCVENSPGYNNASGQIVVTNFFQTLANMFPRIPTDN